jgi:hypothetical protein
VAERGRGREAGLARMDVPAVLGGEPAQLQVLRLHAGDGGDDLAGDLRQPERLGHLARAGVLAARRAADQQDPVGAGRVVVPGLRGLDRGAGGDPVLGQVVVGIGVSGPRLARTRALAPVGVGVPGGGGDPGELGAERVERGIGELAEEAGEELLFGELWAGGALARLRGFGWHRSLRMPACGAHRPFGRGAGRSRRSRVCRCGSASSATAAAPRIVATRGPLGRGSGAPRRGPGARGGPSSAPDEAIACRGRPGRVRLDGQRPAVGRWSDAGTR